MPRATHGNTIVANFEHMSSHRKERILKEAYEFKKHEEDEFQDFLKRCEKKILHSVVRDLPLQQKKCIVLYFKHRLTQRQIAQKLGISPPTVSKNIKSGKENIKNVMKHVRILRKMEFVE